MALETGMNFGMITSPFFDYSNKLKNVNTIATYVLMRTQSMFKWTGLPDTIPQKYLELYLQKRGHCGIAEYRDGLYAVQGDFGGTMDPYFIPVEYIMVDPWLQDQKAQIFKRNENCVVLGNDAFYVGLMPLISKYASALAENELSMTIANVNSRIVSLLSAGDDRTRRAAEEYLKKVADGELGVIAENAFLDGIKAQPYGTQTSNNSIVSLIEYEQYLKASLFNELGLNSNFNMKRESINSNEAQLNDDILFPLVDEMLRMRQEGTEQLNKMFNLEVSVELNSAWEDNEIELEAEQEQMFAETEEAEETEENEEPIKDENK